MPLSASSVWHVPLGYSVICLINLGVFLERINDIAFNVIKIKIAVIIKVNVIQINDKYKYIYIYIYIYNDIIMIIKISITEIEGLPCSYFKELSLTL